MAARISVSSDAVAIADLREHPANPRRGDIDRIADSLAAHGQYRPIVAQRSTGYILAGNHTWKAAKRLGWKKIAVTWIDADDETAARILIADNRMSDLATYDDGALLDLLRSLPDLDGTGFDRHDLDRLDGIFDRPTVDPSGGEPGSKPPENRPQIRLDSIMLRVEPSEFALWTASFAADRKRTVIITDLRTRLGMPRRPRSTPSTAPQRPTEGVETVDLASLAPYPRNARQGDVGAISESLRILGQYRPIVANRRTREILVGNHTWQAARMLGWTTIAVAWVDVDDTEAAKIVAVDNRTSDLATYDDDTLTTLLTSLRSIDGTGYTDADIDDLLRQTATGTPHRRAAPTSRVTCTVGEWAWRIERDDWIDWQRALQPEIDDGQIHTWIAHTLDIPDDTWTAEEP